jgi:large-conductance mechanosensitive channel
MGFFQRFFSLMKGDVLSLATAVVMAGAWQNYALLLMM